MALSNFIIFFHHIKANILHFAHIGNFLPILLSFVEKNLIKKSSVFVVVVVVVVFLFF